MPRHVQMLSSGAASWFSAKLVQRRKGVTPELLFADTLIEDDDNYRFLVEGAADVLTGSKEAAVHLHWWWEGIPDIDKPEARLVHLRGFAGEAMHELPGLHWLIHGMTPWEVFKKERFLGNSRVAKCSHVLKQETCRDWLEENCDPADTTIYVGIHWSEGERFAGGGQKKGSRELWSPWKCEAPLCETPYLAADEAFAELTGAGIKRPRLYDFGYNHANCGGMCVKAGQKHFKRLWETFPERYLIHEREEEKLREYLGKDVAILRDRRGGTTRPLTLRTFRERLQAGQGCDLFDGNEGCGCFSSSPETEADDVGDGDRDRAA